jgi:signal transduction histidine kinase
MTDDSLTRIVESGIAVSQRVQEEINGLSAEALAVVRGWQEVASIGKRVFNESPAGIILSREMDTDYRIVLANSQATKMYGGSLQGRSARELRSQHNDKVQLASLRESMVRNEPWRGRLLGRKLDGIEFPVKVAILPFEDEIGKARLGVTLDLTAVERRASLAAIGEVTAKYVHDENSLLHAPLGFAELLVRDTTLDREKVSHYARLIIDGIERAKYLNTKLLELARGEENYTPAELNLTGLVNLYMDAFKPSLDNQHKVDLDLGSTNNIYADDRQVERLLHNLLTNAVDAMPNGGTLHVGIRDYVVSQTMGTTIGDIPPGQYVRLTITDTGTGITEENREKIFTMFYTNKESGTGLGLAIVKHVAERHNAYVDFLSRTTDPSGTSFQVYFPALEQ